MDVQQDDIGLLAGDDGAGLAGAEQRQQAGDSLSQSRSLPSRAGLQGSHVPLVYLEMDNASQAAALSLRPVYVRSSTLGRYDGGEWRRVGEGDTPVWIADRDDGREDGRVILPQQHRDIGLAAELRYKIYARGATGAGLLSLQGVSEFSLPQVQRYDDGWYRARLFGNISYRAASRPLLLDDVLGGNDLRPGDPGGNGMYLALERATNRVAVLDARFNGASHHMQPDF